MRRGASAAKNQEESYELHEPETWEDECQDRTLVLRKQPLERKVMLIAAGVKEIRCVHCYRVKPFQYAEECGEGWICEDCAAHARS